MSTGKHISYRGAHIDIEALRNENAHVPAVGNMNVNAKGDLLGRGGSVAKTVDEIARENKRIQTAIKHTGLKGAQPDNLVLDSPAVKPSATGPAAPKPKKEKELDNRDITIEGDE